MFGDLGDRMNDKLAARVAELEKECEQLRECVKCAREKLPKLIERTSEMIADHDNYDLSYKQLEEHKNALMELLWSFVDGE